MKRFLVLLLVFLSFAFDVLFFDYDLSDIRHVKEDVSEINKKIDKSLELLFPFYFKSLDFKIKDCEQLSDYRPTPTNVFERNALFEMDEKCKLKSILKKAKISKNDFIKDIKLSDLKNWDKRLYFGHTCEKTEFNEADGYKNYNNGEDLEKNGEIKILSSDDKSIIFFNRKLNRTFFVKEILRANFNNDDTKDILLKISVSNFDNKYVECVNYFVFTKDSANGLFVEKKVE